jgi:selenide,water dikinase
MATLNKYVSEIIERYDITACTDVTGSGLMGHAYEMAKASEKTLIIYKEAIPYLEGAKEYAKLGLIPMGSYNNRKYIEGSYIFHDVEAWMEDILFDPQTSGGLLFTCSEESSIDLILELNKLEIKSKIIGEVHEHKEAYIQVI